MKARAADVLLFLTVVFEHVAEVAVQGWALVTLGGLLYGWLTDNAAVLMLAFFAVLLLVWVASHDERRWEERS
jgi:hypothetical protein